MKEAMRKKLLRVVALFSSPSSWRGLVVTLTGLGVLISPEHIEALTAGGLIIAGLVGIWLEP